MSATRGKKINGAKLEQRELTKYRHWTHAKRKRSNGAESEVTVPKRGDVNHNVTSCDGYRSVTSKPKKLK